MTENDLSLRKHIATLLDWRQAHIEIGTVLDKLSFQDLSKQPTGVPWTLWQLFEHTRIAQWDILEFSRNPNHQSPDWPKGYWPGDKGPKDEATWKASVASFRHDINEMKDLVLDCNVDLHERIPHGDGQTVLREAMLIADHNAYHLGQMVLLMKLLGSW